MRVFLERIIFKEGGLTLNMGVPLNKLLFQRERKDDMLAKTYSPTS